MRYATGQIAQDAAARIDPADLQDPDRHEALLDELRRQMRAFELEVTKSMRAIAKRLLPDDEHRATSIELMDLAVAAVRGFAVREPGVLAAALGRRWAVARGHIARALRLHLEAAA